MLKMRTLSVTQAKRLLTISPVVQRLKRALHGKHRSEVLMCASFITLNSANWRLWAFQEMSEQGRRPGTSPDMYLGFPNYDSEALKGFDKDPCFRNYTIANLRQLWGQGLEFAPVFDHLFDAPMVCFPWAICYIFGRPAGEDSASRNSPSKSMIGRVTGAATAALSIFEGLAKFAEEKQDNRHIPPAIVITFTGPEAAVLLAYLKIDNKRRQDQVRCVLFISGYEANIEEENDTNMGG